MFRVVDRGGGAVLRLQILGSLRVWRNGAEIDPGPPQQAHLLATLLAAAGRPVSTAELIDIVWDVGAPVSAPNIVQKYIGTLRRLLEPSVPAREPGSFIRRHDAGYTFDPAGAVLDVVEFRELVTTARQSAADKALDTYDAALALWRGPAGDGLRHGTGSRPIFDALDREFFDTCVTATDVAVSQDQPERLLPALRLAASMAPFDEPVQASLIVSLAAAGQQAEALSVFATVRARFAEELGAEVGPALRAAHQRVLVPARRSGPVDEPAAQTRRAGVATADALVGRVEELGTLRQAVAAAVDGGSGLVLVEGEPGMGKTRLLAEMATVAQRQGALVVWGRCLEGDATPSMWPWVQVVGAVLDSVPAPMRHAKLAGELGRLVQPRHGVAGGPLMPDSGAQFRLFEEVVALAGQSAGRRPTVLVMDDLQWADGSSLQLLGHLATRLPHGFALIGALRNRAPVPGSELTRFLAAASRVRGHRRIRLVPLAPDEVAQLVRHETGRDPDAGVVREIHARTTGNPFFVRELSRLLASDRGVITAVPATVRDVVRDRMAGLAPDTVAMLQVAAVIGRDVEVRLLAGAAGVDVPACVLGLEPADALDLLRFAPDDPYAVRFSHDLVRESVVAVMPPSSLPRLHLSIADALERTGRGSDAVTERLAHHLWAAGPLAEPARTVPALIRAGSSALTKSALDVAERQLRAATTVARSAGLAELELSALKELAAVVGMRSLYGGVAAVDLLERAEHLARDLGREREAADFLFSRWAGYAQTIDLVRAAPLARLLFEQGNASADPTLRAYGLNAWGIHQWAIGNVGQGVRFLKQAGQALHEYAASRDVDPLRHDLQMLPAAIFAEMTAQHGDLGTAQALLDALEATAGDDPYMVTVWASMAARTAANIGDPVATLRAAERGIAADPGFTFVFQGTYERLARDWALAVTGRDPAGAADRMEQLIGTNMFDPPRSCVATWLGLLAEARLAAGQPDRAAEALDRADRAMDDFGQRYPEGLVLLVRARLLQARGEPAAVVRAAAEHARAVSVAGEAHLYADRAAQLLRELGR
jgi:DNA-binding SARP family transcriptional activator